MEEERVVGKLPSNKFWFIAQHLRFNEESMRTEGGNEACTLQCQARFPLGTHTHKKSIPSLAKILWSPSKSPT